jgi:hypothetical protein
LIGFVLEQTFRNVAITCSVFGILKLLEPIMGETGDGMATQVSCIEKILGCVTEKDRNDYGFRKNYVPSLIQKIHTAVNSRSNEILGDQIYFFTTEDTKNTERKKREKNAKITELAELGN